MPYEFLEDVATADVAIRVTATSLEALLFDAAEATTNVMVDELASLARTVRKTVEVEAQAPDELLVNFLQELIYFKDAERLLLRPERVQVRRQDGRWTLTASLSGEVLDMRKHELKVDVKAVTYHRLRVEQTPTGWQADVILDI